jgi:deoxyribonuclease I
MKLFVGLVFVLLASSSFSQVDQKIGKNWAYYGSHFYATLNSGKTFDRAMFHKIFNDYHVIMEKGQFDKINQKCDRSEICYRHESVGYDRARKIMFGELDTLRDNSGTYVLDVYCGKKFYFRSLDHVSSMHTEVNIEHTWPQSKFNKNFPKDMQKSDMHHLYLTDSRANSMRGNSPFGLVGRGEDRMGGEGCGKSSFGVTMAGDVYTPPVQHRGNVARALFYFSMHYNLPISQSEERILREWHKNDPVDENEIRRHELIAKHQKVRNPFIEYPQIVERISDF